MSKKSTRTKKLTLTKDTIVSMTVSSNVKAGKPATTGQSDMCGVQSCAARSALLNPNC